MRSPWYRELVLTASIYTVTCRYSEVSIPRGSASSRDLSPTHLVVDRIDATDHRQQLREFRVLTWLSRGIEHWSEEIGEQLAKVVQHPTLAPDVEDARALHRPQHVPVLRLGTLHPNLCSMMTAMHGREFQ